MLKCAKNQLARFFRRSARPAGVTEDKEYEYIQGPNNSFHIPGYSLMFD